MVRQRWTTPFEMTVPGLTRAELPEAFRVRAKPYREGPGLTASVKGAAVRAQVIRWGTSMAPRLSGELVDHPSGLQVRGSVSWVALTVHNISIGLLSLSMVITGVVLLAQAIGGRADAWFFGPLLLVVGVAALVWTVRGRATIDIELKQREAAELEEKVAAMLRAQAS